VDEHGAYYLLFAALGALSGFARFLQSSRQWRMRPVVSWSLVGGLLSVAAVGFVYKSDVVEHVWPCVTLSISCGFCTPNAATLFAAMREVLVKSLAVGDR